MFSLVGLFSLVACVFLFFLLCGCVGVSLHVLFLLVFVCFLVSIELNWVSCILFGRHVKFLTSMFVNHHLGYLGICLI